MAETSSSLTSAVDPADRLPLSILRSDTIPPAPTRSGSAIDWIPDCAGYAWIAYGASSLLVISHLPSPLCSGEVLVGPTLRQVFELSADPVSAVSWSPVTPSIGELAAASGNCIFVFSHDSSVSRGSFCWSQNAVLVQSGKVEAIKWTGSADGIIAGGNDVVLWRRKYRSWEIAWKLKADEPQDLVSATWSIQGPFASAAYPNRLHDKGSSSISNSVFIYNCDSASHFGKHEVCHPQPVSMIQWRPSIDRKARGDGKNPRRHMLLTCCLDGTARLWTQVDSGKVRKGKESNDCQSTRRSYCVAAVIEINQILNGNLGVDIFLNWATESSGLYRAENGTKWFSSSENDVRDWVGQCEWLIGFGPGTVITFWAIHCLDDMSPIRFPRVTLWKRQELQDLEGTNQHEVNFSNFKDALLLNKVVFMRDCLSGPPDVCSLVHLLPCNSLVWSLLHVQRSGDTNTSSAIISKNFKRLHYSSGDVLNGGHTGKILQVAIHPRIYELGLAASLDSNGLLLFWSVSKCNLGLSELNPSWKLQGRYATDYSCSMYTSLKWAPSVLDGDPVLLMGHVGGIDCLIVKDLKTKNDISCHYICTIPLTGRSPHENGAPNIYAIPLPSTCAKAFIYNKFMLMAVWMNSFEALSWEVTLHSYDLQVNSCECCFGDQNKWIWRFENTIASKRYWLGVNPRSSQLPEPYCHDNITSYSVIGSGCLIPMQESLGLDKDVCCTTPAYIMATGCSDGSLKLWKSNSSKMPTPPIFWELVGKLISHPGCVSAICLTNNGEKIATISAGSGMGSSSLCIWHGVHLIGAGKFVLEDTLSIDKDVVTLNWLTLGNGQSMLGICTQNELQVYSKKRSGVQNSVNHGKIQNPRLWSCIAVARTLPAIQDLIWGPQAAAVIIHDSYFIVLSQWLSLMDDKKPVRCYPNHISLDAEGGKGNHVVCSIFSDSDISTVDIKEPSLPMKLNGNVWCPSSNFFTALAHANHSSGKRPGFCSLAEISEKLNGTLPVFHPESLLMNLYSGNWKRTYAAVRHLSKCLTSECASQERCSSAMNSHAVPQIPLPNYFEGILFKDSKDKKLQWSGNTRLPVSSSQYFEYNTKFDASESEFSSSTTRSELHSFVESLEKKNDFAALADGEKLQILAILDLLIEIQQSSSAYENLDEPGRRYWVALRFQQLHFHRSSGKSLSVAEMVVDSKLMSWAFHSDCQETLLSSFLPHEPSWKEMQVLGVGFWFTNVAQLRTRMEKLARMQYLRKKDPKDCALFYIALNRLQVLAGLFKISKDEKDKPLVGFLARNFQEEKNKAAALKNAYVLMGRHQLELAIAFFLLGCDYNSAVTVCAKNFGDEQLALVICRLVEGRGGSLERQLISRSILPSATERGDYWLASLLEWELGNYSESFLSMLGLQRTSTVERYALSSNDAPFLDPHIGLYCLKLGTKNCMRNAVGEKNVAILSRWATVMAATAFNRIGLPLEALECLSSSSTFSTVMDQGSLSNIDSSQTLHEILKLSNGDSPNWLSSNVSLHLESCAKVDLVLQYFSKLMEEHPSLPYSSLGSLQSIKCFEDYDIHRHKSVLGNFRDKLYSGLLQVEQKFAVVPSCVLKMILIWLCNNGLFVVGYGMLVDYMSRNHLQDESHSVDHVVHYPLFRHLLKVVEDIPLLLSRFIVSSSIYCIQLKPGDTKNDLTDEVRPFSSDSCIQYFQGTMQAILSLRSALRIISGFMLEDVITKILDILDLYEVYVHFASAWVRRNSKGLLLMVQPLLISCTNGHTPYEVDMKNIKSIICSIEESSARNSAMNRECSTLNQDRGINRSFPEDEKWCVLGVCLWQHMSKLTRHHFHLLSIDTEDSCLVEVSHIKASFWASSSMTFGSDDIITEQVASFLSTLVNLLKTTLVHVSSYHVKSYMSFLHLQIENRFKTSLLAWLQESSRSQSKILCQDGSADAMDGRDESSTLDLLWDSCADPNMIADIFAEEKISWSLFFNKRVHCGWSDFYRSVNGEHNTVEVMDHENRLSNDSSRDEVGLPSKGLLNDGRFVLGIWQKDIYKEELHFQNAKEIYKRDGELLEALCINSVNERQAAIASNRKGIIFFGLKDGESVEDESELVWSDADWPLNGWASAESTPVPTCVSPGIGLGSKKGAHLGLVGATLGVGSLARQSILSDSGAFGIPSYAGMAPGLGWGVQEDFEEFVDPPATVENISTRAFSSHPSRPFFLVGSSNTHIYLWEFGKDKATATYGVLPAANVPPPYALASISAVEFDHYGHRFATAALDGTVCTWQLEVGGRCNICPIESSLCFNGHASDVAYVASSGSIVAAAGYSSNGANVVVWDTLAPPTTSRASLLCHEGGARSISVFDNDIGSGSVSPLIVTGGKGGDVGLHDFRYIATGKTKRHKNHDNGERNSNASTDSHLQAGVTNKVGHQNQNGMLWYIPKAHLGSVTKIATIPDTSLFLTGSKDGDVKLWDAKAAKLVHHWPRLHERRTFLQPSSLGFGGVVRPAVTDIQVLSHGFVTCGGDGSVKLILLQDYGA